MRARSGETPTRVCASPRSFSFSLSLSHVPCASIAAIIAVDATYVRYSMTPRSPRCVAYARARVGGTSVRVHVYLVSLSVRVFGARVGKSPLTAL